METASVENPLVAKALAAAPAGIFINGAWREARGGEWFGVINPATGDVVTRVVGAGTGDDPAALGAAAAAQDDQARAAPQTRAELLRSLFEIIVERAGEFVVLMTIRMGKPLTEVCGEAVYGAEFLRQFSEGAVRLNGRYPTAPGGDLRVITMPHPVGPVLAIIPWNFSLATTTRKLGPVLAAGCTGVLKPSELTPLTVLAFVEACWPADIPDGIVDVVPTSSSTALTEPLLRDSRLRKLPFTGPTDVGKELPREATDNVLRTSMELGGCVPFIVFGDADLGHVVATARSAKLRNIGEARNAANQFYVSRELADEFAACLAAEFEGLVVGDGLDPNTDIGPIITSGQRQHIRGFAEGVHERGAKVLTGGEGIARPGYFYRPTVLTVTDPGEPMICEELFGPVTPMVPFDSKEQVLAWANSSPVGLAAHIHTRDIGRALWMTEQLEVDMTGINSVTISNPTAPSGGVRHSGLGREGGSKGIAEYLETIYVRISVRVPRVL